MTRTQDDFLKECLSDVGAMPLDAFNMLWCRVCGRRECSRAGLNNSVFDQRARNWKETLFLKVPRADDNDPRYANIRAKRFLPIAPAAEAWTQPQAQEPPVVPEEPPPPPPDDPEDEAPDTDPAPEPVPETGGPSPPPPAGAAVQAQVNTPFQQGSMIGGKEPPPPQPAPGADAVLGSDSTYTFDDD